MKKLILLSLLFMSAYASAQVIDTPRYAVYFDKFGVQHTSLVPTKLVVITGLFNDLLSKPTTIAGYGITDGVTTSALSSALGSYVPTSRTLTINGTTLDLSANRSWTIGSGSVTLTGDVTGTGSGSIATTLKNTGTAGTYTKVTTDAQGRVTSATQATTSDISEGSNLYYTSGRTVANTLSKSANYTIVSGDFSTTKASVLYLSVDCTSGNNTQTLPSASTFSGYTIYVRKTDATSNTVTISGLTGDNVIGTQGWVKQVISNGTTWQQN